MYEKREAAQEIFADQEKRELEDYQRIIFAKKRWTTGKNGEDYFKNHCRFPAAVSAKDFGKNYASCHEGIKGKPRRKIGYRKSSTKSWNI